LRIEPNQLGCIYGELDLVTLPEHDEIVHDGTTHHRGPGTDDREILLEHFAVNSGIEAPDADFPAVIRQIATDQVHQSRFSHTIAAGDGKNAASGHGH